MVSRPLDVVFILSWLIVTLVSIIVTSYIGLSLGKKVKGRYLAIISLMHWTVTIGFFYLLSTLPVIDPLRNLLVLSVIPIFLSNIALDVVFVMVYSKRARVELVAFNRCTIGIVLGVIGGVMSLFESVGFVVRLAYSPEISDYLIAWNLVVAALSLLILMAAFMTHIGRRVLGGVLMFVVSLSLLFVNITPMSAYHGQSAPSWLLSSVLGGALILLSKSERTGKKEYSDDA